MTTTDNTQNRPILRRIAHRVMLERGLAPDFSGEALAQLDGIHGAATQTAGRSVPGEPRIFERVFLKKRAQQQRFSLCKKAM